MSRELSAYVNPGVNGVLQTSNQGKANWKVGHIQKTSDISENEQAHDVQFLFLFTEIIQILKNG